MKKTLIALAAVAAATAASAQVTMTGSFSYGFQSTTTAAGVKNSGWGFDDTDLAVSASEDLGGGLKIAVSAGFEGLAESDGVNAGRGDVIGKGATMTLSGQFGTVTMTSAEGSDYLALDAVTGTVANGTDADRIRYTMPAVAGFKPFVQYADGAGAAATGYGYGVDSDNDQNYAIGTDYANGPLSANLTFVKFDGAHAAINNRVLAKVGYDFGVMTASFGIATQDGVPGQADVTETAFSVGMPVNAALSLGVDVATSKTSIDGQADADSLMGYGFTATYALSKRTSVVGYYENAETAQRNSKELSVRMVHNF